MNVEKVESYCKNLPTILRCTIRDKILKLTPDQELTLGQVLVFSLADHLMAEKLSFLPTENLRVVLEEFAPQIVMFGDEYQKSGDKCPVCKVGFLDRKYACIDGVPKFLDIETGSKFLTIERVPFRSIVYNLATLAASLLSLGWCQRYSAE